MRVFESGATRSSNNGKLEYHGFLHPLVEQSFARYMHKHRIQEDGKLRDSNNWWLGWSKEISLQSLVRHVEDLKAIDAGYKVIKVKDGEETTYYKNEWEVEDFLQELAKTNKDAIVEIISEEECVNAVKFNCNSYMLELLRNKS